MNGNGIESQEDRAKLKQTLRTMRNNQQFKDFFVTHEHSLTAGLA